MKIFVLEYKGWADVGSSQSIAIIANNEESARKIARKENHDNNEWLSSDYVACEEIKDFTKERILVNYILYE